MVAVLILPAEFLLRGPESRLAGFSQAHDRLFDGMIVGETKTELLEKFGLPLHEKTDFPHEIYYQAKACSKGELDECVEFLTFRNGMNWYYVFGIDAKGRIALKAEGHS